MRKGCGIGKSAKAIREKKQNAFDNSLLRAHLEKRYPDVGFSYEFFLNAIELHIKHGAGNIHFMKDSGYEIKPNKEMKVRDVVTGESRSFSFPKRMKVVVGQEFKLTLVKRGRKKQYIILGFGDIEPLRREIYVVEVLSRDNITGPSASDKEFPPDDINFSDFE